MKWLWIEGGQVRAIEGDRSGSGSGCGRERAVSGQKDKGPEGWEDGEEVLGVCFLMEKKRWEVKVGGRGEEVR